jgi:hypothetical protein
MEARERGWMMERKGKLSVRIVGQQNAIVSPGYELRAVGDGGGGHLRYSAG